MRALGVDTGDRRVGLAVSGPGGIVLGIPLLERRDWESDLAALAAVVEDKRAEVVVVGLPLNMDGSEGPRARLAREFGDALAARIGVPVEYWDERLSSVEAEERLKGVKLGKGAKKAHVNTVAAQVILESWLAGKRGHPGR
ncbi:MAG: Holliday junction resolvase RuvX [Planctomycetia bacterium]|nr:Holliday junction resolvase RuvX [Planctomycetia bacterium]